MQIFINMNILMKSLSFLLRNKNCLSSYLGEEVLLNLKLKHVFHYVSVTLLMFSTTL